MTIQLGDAAPDFTQDSTEGPIHFYDYIDGSWAVLFSHPADFTPVCTTELGAVAKLVIPDVTIRASLVQIGPHKIDYANFEVLGLSVDGLSDHESWSKDIEETQGTKLNFPLIADHDRTVADLYGMIHPNAHSTLTVRSVFIVGPDKKLKLSLTYPASTGRNFDEILRVIDSLQLTSEYQVATPANWEDGQDCIIVPSVSNEEAQQKFPKGFKEIKPYLRTTPQPNRLSRVHACRSIPQMGLNLARSGSLPHILWYDPPNHRDSAP